MTLQGLDVNKYSIKRGFQSIMYDFTVDIFSGNLNHSKISSKLIIIHLVSRQILNNTRTIDIHFGILIYTLFTGPALPCTDPLGMQDGTITDNQIQNSVARSTLYPPQSARLWHADGVTYGYVPMSYTDTNQFIEVDLQRVVWISGITMQGIDSPEYQCWTKIYRVEYSLDRISWFYVNDEHSIQEVSLGAVIDA